MIKDNVIMRHPAVLAEVVVIASLLLFLPVVGFCGELSQQKILEHLSLGEESFRKAMELDQRDPAAARDYYRRAVLHFERIVQEGGTRNGRLYYNIGNIYFRLGDLGRAILYYKRAALYTPNDANLKQNLDYARSRRIDRIEEKEMEKIFKTLFFLHYDLPSRWRLVIFTVSFALVWISAALLLFVSRGSIRAVLVSATIVCALFLASLVVESVARVRRPEGVITAEEIIARKGDAETYQPSFTEPLHSGTEFNLLEARSDWLYVELKSGARCWIPSSSAELVTR